MLNLTSRALRAFKPFDVDVTPLVAPHGGLVGKSLTDGKSLEMSSATWSNVKSCGVLLNCIRHLQTIRSCLGTVRSEGR